MDSETEDALVPYKGDKNPLKGTQGALVRLRSGELAIIAPQDSDEYDLCTDGLWHQMDEDDDIVAYKPLPVSKSERLARAAARYFQLEEVYTKPPLGGHAISSHVMSSARADLKTAVAEYKAAWPDWPEHASLRRLRKWETDDD